MKILTILGARPQFIKAGSVSREISKHDEIEEVIVHTGQHYDANMSDVFFDEMKIPKPNYFLGIGGKSHGAMTGRMIEKIEEVALAESPDWIVVYGDTNSTLAGAIVASKLHIKLAHIEAGLRSFNMRMPEEVNRILTDRVSDILFCPTDTAVQNLHNEAYDRFNCEIVNCGDVMYDGAMFYKDLSVRPSFNIDDNYILATIHRAENTDDISKLNSIIQALNKINEEKQVIVPLHPRTEKRLEDNKIRTEFTIVEPVGYLEMVWLINNCDLVITDSGGLQKEAFFFQKNCLVIRDETEWIELVDKKYNKLVPAKTSSIVQEYKEGKDYNKDFNIQIYGNANASRIIVNKLKSYKG